MFHKYNFESVSDWQEHSACNLHLFCFGLFSTLKEENKDDQKSVLYLTTSWTFCKLLDSCQLGLNQDNRHKISSKWFISPLSWISMHRS